MSESPQFKIDFGVAEAFKSVVRLSAIMAESTEDTRAAETRMETLEQAKSKLDTLQEISLSVRKFHFDADGLRYRLRAFSDAPTARNARRFGKALKDAHELVTVGRDKLASAWESPSGKQIRAAHPNLAEGADASETLKGLLWELLFSPKSMLERVPFARSRRYKRLADQFQEHDLEEIFDKVNGTVNSSLRDLASQIAEYEAKVEKLSARPRVTREKKDK